MTVLAATGSGYAYAGWSISAVAGAGYVWWVLARGRKVAQQVPEDKRRWSDSS